MIFGYMRISTNKASQKVDRQKLTLQEYAKANNFAFAEIISERVSGTIKAVDREQYKKLKDRLRHNDILVITDLDRLGRSADDVILELKDLKSKGVKVVALDIPYLNDFNKTSDNSIYQMVIDIVITLKAHMAQQEREKLVSRINQGLAVAKAKGKKLGRPSVKLPTEFIKEYRKFLNGDYGKISATQFAKLMQIGRSTLYKYIKIYESENM